MIQHSNNAIIKQFNSEKSWKLNTSNIVAGLDAGFVLFSQLTTAVTGFKKLAE